MIIAKSTSQTVVFERDNGDFVLRRRPDEPKLAKKSSRKLTKSKSEKAKAS